MKKMILLSFFCLVPTFGHVFGENALAQFGWVQMRPVSGGIALWVESANARRGEVPNLDQTVLYYIQFDGIPTLAEIPDPNQPVSVIWNKARGDLVLRQGEWKLTWSVKSKEPRVVPVVGLTRYAGPLGKILGDLESPETTAITPDDMCSSGGKGASQCGISCGNGQCDVSCVDGFYACCFCAGPQENRPRCSCKVYTPTNT